MKLFVAFILSAICLTITAGAESMGKKTCRIIFPERPKDAPKVAQLFDGKTSRQVLLPNMNFSKVIDLPAGDLKILLTPNPIKGQKDLPPNAPSLNIPENVTDFYIIVTPNPENLLLPIKMEMVSLNDGKFKVGEMLWINHTNHQIEAKLGENKILIDPKGQEVAKSPVSASGYYRAEFTFQKEAKGDFKKISEQSWWHDVKHRHLGFIVDNGKRLPKVFYFRDFRTGLP